MESRYFIGNWKMNHLPVASKEYVEDFSLKLTKLKELNPNIANNTVGIAPTFTSLSEVSKSSSSNILIGAQNCHWKDSGAFTGEISAQMLKSIGTDFVICGHSERRQYFGETSETTSLRAKAAIKAGMKAIVCVGETAEQFEAGASQEIVESQLLESIDNIEKSSELIIAYEPVWAIGTGLNATPQIAESIHSLIREKLVLTYGSDGSNIPILYGGSTKASNIKELIKEPNINGALVGGASLKVDDFIALVEAGS